MLFYQIHLDFDNRRTLKSHMFDDFLAVSSYGKLSAQFDVGRSRLIEMMGVMSCF